jgi:hypothetical protein
MLHGNFYPGRDWFLSYDYGKCSIKTLCEIVGVCTMYNPAELQMRRQRLFDSIVCMEELNGQP